MMTNSENYAEYIMFTQNENIISKIEENDWLNKLDIEHLLEENNSAALLSEN